MEKLDRSPDGPYIVTVKLGPKGQIVIPKEIRSRSGIQPGENLVLVADINGSFMVHPASSCRELVNHLLTQLPNVLSAIDGDNE